MLPAASLSELLPMPEGQKTSLPLLDVKNDTKLVLVAIPGGTEIAAHQVPYPATVLLLNGSIDVMLGETWTSMAPGETLAVPTDLRHAIRAGKASYFIVAHLRGLGARGMASI